MEYSQDDRVTVNLADAVEALRDLNEYVVSLDRILSRIGTGGHDPEILLDYVVDRNVMHRLAHLREVVGAALDAVSGKEEADQIAESSYRYTDKAH